MRKILLMAVPLGLLACGGEGGDNIETDIERLTVSTDTIPGFETAAGTGLMVSPDTGRNMTIAGTLKQMNQTGVTVSMTMTAVEGGTRILFNANPLPPNSAVDVIIAPGDCAGVLPTGTPVATVAANASGSATNTTVIPIPAAAIMDGRHVVLVKGRQAGPATPPLACSEIPLNAPGGAGQEGIPGTSVVPYP